MIDFNTIDRAKRKALKSGCKYKVAAIGFDKRGQLLGVLTAVPHVNRLGGSIHAEVRAIQNLNGVRELVILHVNAKGKLKPIDPCRNCERYARRFGVKIRTIL